MEFRYQVNVICPKCKCWFPVLYSDELVGKDIKMTCPNDDCHHSFGEFKVGRASFTGGPALLNLKSGSGYRLLKKEDSKLPKVLQGVKSKSK